MFSLDGFDVQILKAMQEDPRCTLSQLSDKVCLSISQCSRRIQQLENAGVINGHLLDICPGKVGLHVSAFVFLSFNKGKVVSPVDAVAPLLECENVTDCHAITGTHDVIIKVVVSDLNALSELLTSTISSLDGIRDIHTSVVMNTLKSNGPVPVAMNATQK